MTIETRGRLETQLAADVVWLLLVSGVIDRKRFTSPQLAETVGCSIDELDNARRRCEEFGFEVLKPIEGDSTPAPRERERTPERRPSRAPVREFNEKKCERCGDWFPIEQFETVPASKRRGGLCTICRGEVDRDLFVAIRKAQPLHQVVAYYRSASNDASVGMTCGKCGEPIRLNEPVSLQAEPHHVKCPKVGR